MQRDIVGRSAQEFGKVKPPGRMMWRFTEAVDAQNQVGSLDVEGPQPISRSGASERSAAATKDEARNAAARAIAIRKSGPVPAIRGSNVNPHVMMLPSSPSWSI
jgi:hypothetical protein